MRFSLISAIATIGSVATAQPVARALSSEQTVEGLNVLTKLAQKLEAPAQSISIVNAPLFVIGQGPFPVIIRGNTDIISYGSGYISSLDGTQPYSGEECTTITGSYEEFVRVNQVYLNILIGKAKADILKQVPFVGPPMAATLRQMEGVYDTITFKLIDLCASTGQELTSQGNSLHATLDLAIQQYDGLIGRN